MIKFQIFLVVLVSLVTLTEVMANNMFKDFFEVILDRFEVIYDSPDITMNLKVRKVNKVKCLIGNVTLRGELNEGVKSEFKTLKKQGGEFRYLPYRIPITSHCELYDKDSYALPDIIKGSNMPPHCPLPVGTYTWYNVSLSMTNLPKGMIQTGEYGVEGLYYKDSELILHYKIFAYVNVV